MPAIIVQDIFWGDSGKGATVDFLCSKFKTKYIIKASGAHQCGHNVVDKNGFHCCFSQLGSGTLLNVPTYIDRDFLIDPIRFKNEFIYLKDYSPQVLINKNCSITTSLHKLANKATNFYGSCGLGVGMTRLTDLKNVKINIYDDNNIILEKLRTIRAILEDHIQKEININIYKETSYLLDNIDFIKNNCQIVSDIHLTKKDWIIFEGSQGLLLNEYDGWNPKESTWGNVSPRNAVEKLEYLDIPYVILGVMRTYLTRHGGLLQSEFKEINNITDKYNPYNDFQKDMKFYEHNELLLLKQIAKVDLLAVNHLDEFTLDMSKFEDKIMIKSYGNTRYDRNLIKDIR
jgi:adenylosuccinate synthase